MTDNGEAARLRVLNLGAGVQSTTMLLMAAAGDIGPMPDVAIFADTQSEPPTVYRHLATLEAMDLPFPIVRVTAGDLVADQMSRNSRRSGRWPAVPWFTSGGGIGRRQCTSHYKIEPIEREIRRCLGLRKRQRAKPGAVEQWLGISTDEAHRAKPSRHRWITRRWPLIDAGMSRRDCLRWLEQRGHPHPPRSSCICCPFHSDAEWRAVLDDPGSRATLEALDQVIRDPGRGLRCQQFMHRSLRPIGDVDLRTAEERGQMNLFGNECEGMCGV